VCSKTERKKQTKISQPDGKDEVKAAICKATFGGNPSAFCEAERVTEVRAFLLMKGSLPASGLTL